MIKVIGHFPPDTDTVCSPIVYAWYLTNFKGMPAKAYRAGELNRETEYVLNRFGIEKPEIMNEIIEGDELIIMDTNNPDEILKGLEKAKILEIIDHHKLIGNISTPDPINITIRTVACTATVVYEMIVSDGNNISSEMASLLLACIVSDTLNFTSPTTTSKDKVASEALAKISEIDLNELATEMFAAKSNLDGFSAEEILLMDAKKYDMGTKKVMMGILETTLPENAVKMVDELRDSMNKLKESRGYDLFFFFIVDILNNSSKLLIAGEEETFVAQKAFNTHVSGVFIELPGVVSRKKQMIPKIENLLSN